MVLIARDFHGRTESTIDYLIDQDLPIKKVRVALYEDAQKRRFLSVEGGHEPDIGAGSDGAKADIDYTKIAGRKITVADLVENNLLTSGDELVWTRKKLGQEYHATITEDGTIRLRDGRIFSSPSGAAMANVPNSIDGWFAWHLVGRMKSSTTFGGNSLRPPPRPPDRPAPSP